MPPSSPADIPALAADIERVTGPFQGYFLASYAVKSNGAFVGYSKICPARPDDVWECQASQKVGSLPCSNELDAVDAADVLAMQLIACLAPHGDSLRNLFAIRASRTNL